MTKCYAAINNNIEIRHKSSSGGVFYELAKYVLDNKGVVFGAAFDNEWNVIIKYIDNIDDLPQLMKSKYVKVRNLNTFKDCKNFLDEGKLVLYSNTPCQIYALKHYLKQEYNNLITVDIACHGTPTISSWHNYLKEINYKTIKSIDFRDKQKGWVDYHFTIKYDNNTILSEHHNTNKFMKDFLQDKNLTTCCKKCGYQNELSKADITIGDFWGIDMFNRQLNDNKGISAIIIRSNIIDDILHNNCNLTLIQSDIKYFKICNAGFQNR